MSDLIRLLNRSEGGKTRKLIRESFHRHTNSFVNFDYGKGNNFDGCRYKKITEKSRKQFVITANMDYLYAAYDDVCDINIDKFLSLSLGLQSWLYGFFCSAPHLSSIDIDTLHEISGSSYNNLQDFKKAVKAALSVLEKKGFIGWSYGITRDGRVFWENKNLL